MVLLSPWFRAPEWRSLRLTGCIATGLSAFAPIGHAWYLWGSAYLVGIGVPYYLLEGAFLLAGCYIYQVGTLPRDQNSSTHISETSARVAVSRPVRYLGPLAYPVARLCGLVHCRTYWGSMECTRIQSTAYVPIGAAVVIPCRGRPYLGIV